MSTKNERLQALQHDLQKTVKPFTVTTQGGRVRQIIGTLNEKYIPLELRKQMRKVKENVLEVFEIKEQRWNRMPFENVRKLKVY